MTRPRRPRPRPKLSLALAAPGARSAGESCPPDAELASLMGLDAEATQSAPVSASQRDPAPRGGSPAGKASSRCRAAQSAATGRSGDPGGEA